MFLATRHGNGAECVSCIVYFKVFGPWQGPWHCFYYCLWKGGSPLFAFRSTLAHTKDSIHGGDHEPIHEQHSSSTSDSGNREEVTTSLSYGHGVSVWTRWEGDNARESRATVSWVWESLVKQSRDLALLSQEMHVNTRRMESKNRNEDFEKLFEGRDFPFESFFPCSRCCSLMNVFKKIDYF